MNKVHTLFAAVALCVAISHSQGQPPIIGCRKALDLVLVVDDSDSISDQDFEKIKTSITKLIDNLDIDSDKIWLGLVLYSSDISEIVALQQNKHELLQRISLLKRARTGTNTALGIHTMNAMLHAGRDGVPKMGVVITDGVSLDVEATHVAAMAAIDAGVRMFSVGIGRLIHDEELQGIATGPEHVLNFLDFDHMSLDVIEKVASENCAVSGCPGQLDMVTVVDGSDSITEDDFSTLKAAILSLLDELILGEDHVKFGLVLYSSNITTVLDLSSNKKQLQTQVASLTHSRQGTNTHKGIKEMNSMFTRKGRKGVPKVGIVITDGISKDPASTAKQAALAKAKEVNMYAVGIAQHIDIAELKSIASSSNNVISYQRFDQLKSGIVSLMKQVCPNTTTTTTAPQPVTTTKTQTTTITKTTMTTPIVMATTTPAALSTTKSPDDCTTRSVQGKGKNGDKKNEADDSESEDEDDDDSVMSKPTAPRRHMDSDDSEEDTDDLIPFQSKQGYFPSYPHQIGNKVYTQEDTDDLIPFQSKQGYFPSYPHQIGNQVYTQEDTDDLIPFQSKQGHFPSYPHQSGNQVYKHGLWNRLFGRRRDFYDDDMNNHYRGNYGHGQRTGFYHYDD